MAFSVVAVKVISHGSGMDCPVMLEKRENEDLSFSSREGLFLKRGRWDEASLGRGITHHLNAQSSMCLSSRWLPEGQGPVINMCRELSCGSVLPLGAVAVVTGQGGE